MEPLSNESKTLNMFFKDLVTFNKSFHLLEIFLLFSHHGAFVDWVKAHYSDVEKHLGCLAWMSYDDHDGNDDHGDDDDDDTVEFGQNLIDQAKQQGCGESWRRRWTRMRSLTWRCSSENSLHLPFYSCFCSIKTKSTCEVLFHMAANQLTCDKH